MKLRSTPLLTAAACSALSIGMLAACGDDDTAKPPITPVDSGAVVDSGMPVDSGMDAGADAGPQTACQKYGGASVIDTVVQKNLVTKIAGDCRISKHFTDLVVGNDASRLTHVSECLSTQVQELFGCPGVKYAGSKDKAGVVCRDMVAAHASAPNKIAQKDFDALIEDVVATLTEAGVESADINAVAPTLTSTEIKAAIITAPAAAPANCYVTPDTTTGDAANKCIAGGAPPTTTCVTR